MLVSAPLPLEASIFPKKWVRNLETVVNRFSKALRFYFQIYWNITQQTFTFSKPILKEILRKKMFIFKKWTIQKPGRVVLVSIVNFEHISLFYLVFQLLILNIYLLTRTKYEIWWPVSYSAGAQLTRSLEPKNEKIVFYNLILRLICIISRVAIIFPSVWI